jgi:hypothetical protein
MERISNYDSKFKERKLRTIRLAHVEESLNSTPSAAKKKIINKFGVQIFYSKRKNTINKVNNS